MRFFLSSDNTDAADGFRLAGVRGVTASGRGDALRALREATEDPGVGIVLVTEKLYASLADEIGAARAAHPDHLIVGVPDRDGGEGSSEDMARFVKETVGIDI